VIADLISRFKKAGFESLSGEDLAICVTTPDFPNNFKLELGLDWKDCYEKKAIDKVHK